MKGLFLALLSCCASVVHATRIHDGHEDEPDDVFSEQQVVPLTPTYLKGVIVDGAWNGNWFVSLRGGLSAFVGSPVGRGDVFDRTSCLVNVSFGKWFTPYVGGRIACQGFKFKDSELRSRTFQSVHADFLYNVSAHYFGDNDELPRWNVSPYFGCGIIHNAHHGKKPFAVSCGVIAGYRISKRLHVNAELGVTTTLRDFDGKGNGGKFGDNLLQASAGLSYSLGKVGWKRPVDAMPYIYQNDFLVNYVNLLREQNINLKRKHNTDEEALREMKKILEIEGLLGKYDVMPHSTQAKTYPKNDYSGLNSLRARLRNRDWNGDVENYMPVLADDYNNRSESDHDAVFVNNGLYDLESIAHTVYGKDYIGAPIFFFYAPNSTNFIEKAQIINIDKIAQVVTRFDLNVLAVGAADSQTGTEGKNKTLSIQRAGVIKSLLVSKGVGADAVKEYAVGGVNAFTPFTANRQACVMLFSK